MLSTEQTLKIFQSMNKVISKYEVREICRNIYHSKKDGVSKIYTTNGHMLIAVQIKADLSTLNSALPIVNLDPDHEKINTFESLININDNPKSETILINSKYVGIAINVIRSIYKILSKGDPSILINATGEKEKLYLSTSKDSFYIHGAIMPMRKDAK